MHTVLGQVFLKYLPSLPVERLNLCSVPMYHIYHAIRTDYIVQHVHDIGKLSLAMPFATLLRHHQLLTRVIKRGDGSLYASTCRQEPVWAVKAVAVIFVEHDYRRLSVIYIFPELKREVDANPSG